MATTFLETNLLAQFLTFTLVLTRVSGLVMTAPIFGTQGVPMRIRGLLAVALALLITPMFAGTSVEDPGNLPNYLVYLGGEAMVGLLIGIGITILFSGIQVAGQIISQLSGMALADVFSPGFDANVPLYSQLLFFVTMAVFVLIDGHRLVMAALLDTFYQIPPGAGGLSGSVTEVLTTILSQSFVLGIRAAAPIMTALLLSTLVLGLISRTMPQLNIIAVGFGLNSLVTLGGLFFAMGAIVWVFQEQVEPVLELLGGALDYGNG